jgi:hypothetical protein
MSTPNPFEVLQLDPLATPEEIVAQAGRLRQTAADEEEMNRIRQAVQALTAQPEDRDLVAMFTFPRPGYQLPERDRFLQAFRRSPAPAAPMPTDIPPLDETEVAMLILGVLSEELAAPPVPLEPLPLEEGAEDIRAQQAEALWQSLLYDSRG